MLFVVFFYIKECKKVCIDAFKYVVNWNHLRYITT